jgi:hypothetical protein
VVKTNRDEFSPKTKLQIAKRAGWLCSNPACRAMTVGATADGKGEMNLGTASHICAAAPLGPRYQEMSVEERRSASNGIWMCRDHGTAIDSDEAGFSIDLLRGWKRQAEEDAFRRVMRNEPPPVSALQPDQMRAKLRRSAEADLAVFQNTAKWPRTAVPLTLKIDGYREPVTTNTLVRVVLELDDLIITAPPGMGKTTTVFQIAEGILANDIGIPVILALGDWATGTTPIIESVLARTAFRDVSDQEFRAVAANSGVVLLLDGWNELDAASRERARVQIETLKAEVPTIGLLMTTRRQVLDVPISGRRVDLLSLNHEQQMAIAKAIRGEPGRAIVDQAWRTPGIRELVSTPLYLTALLSMPDGAPFPTTKEEVLGRFVAAHEKDARRAEALRAAVRGFQQDFLEALAVYATGSAKTAIADGNARRAVAEVAANLIADEQIAAKPEPEAVLEVLVNNHVLMRSGDTPGVSFQHQQFQEWYASHAVERLIMAAVGDAARWTTAKAEVFNLPEWEEPILFAIERMARGDEAQRKACAAAILAAFDVDPMLCAEMICRGTDETWGLVKAVLLDLVGRWHTPLQIDRALRFMMNSGRPEFLDQVWPLITHDDDQVSLRALRNCRQFRTSILGPDPVKRVQALADRPRSILLIEIASRSGIDGLDLVSTIGQDDPAPEVRSAVIDALAFRRADRHVTEVLKKAGDGVYDQVVRKGLVDVVTDNDVKQRLDAAHARIVREDNTAHDRLRQIAYAGGGEDRSADLTAILCDIDMQNGNDPLVQLVHQARKRYPQAVAEGLLERLRSGGSLFHGADDILASAGFSIDDDWAIQIALAEAPDRDIRAESAASILGPASAARMVGALLEVAAHVKNPQGNYDRAASDRCNQLEMRIAHIPGASLVAAVQEKSGTADDEQLSRLARLLSRPSDSDGERGRHFTADGQAAIRALIEDWGNRLLASGTAKRWHLATIAVLASRVPDVTLLPVVRRLLDENIRRHQGFREKAEASGWSDMEAANEARQPMTNEYQWAFLAIRAPETTELMTEYLPNSSFGELAAAVLASHWREAHEPPPEKRFLGGVDFGVVTKKRVERARDPAATSEAAEAIFAAIERLLGEDLNEEKTRLVVALGITGAGLPHGQRDQIIGKLIERMSWPARGGMLLNLILQGEDVEADLVAAGIAATFEAAKKEPWKISPNEGYELRSWLRLLPFTTDPKRAIEVVRAMPDEQKIPKFLEEMIEGFSFAPSPASEEVLFRLAEDDPRLYQNYRWRDAVLKLRTEAAICRLIDLTANGVLDGRPFDLRHWARDLAPLMAAAPKARQHVYNLLRKDPSARALEILAAIVSDNPDAEGLLLLVEIEAKVGKSLIDWRAIEHVVTKHVPDESWNGAYNVVPDPVPDLRRMLLSMVKDGGAADAAARCLNYIDTLRDEYGLPPSEPRHPDLGSGKPWPMILQS